VKEKDIFDCAFVKPPKKNKRSQINE
ncbi:uncharacterized protein METZ01_LOCUS114886, partial [marine metagenome]